MSESAEDEDDWLLAAEYLLGLLEPAERAIFERRLGAEPALREALAYWEARFAPLAAGIAPVAPSAALWRRIEARIAPETAKRDGWWNSLGLWRGLAFGAGALAAASVAALVVLRPGPAPVPRAMATLEATGGGVFVATLEAQGAGMLVVIAPANVPAAAPGKSEELWLMPANGKPEAIGLLPTDRPVTLPMPSDTTIEKLASGQLGISLEPAGGSPSGLPTGPVIAAAGVRLL